jgi:Asp-tRNA(Asn)/Glu-tRNA(Gln) amidotransferase A subunit family amidase
VVLRLERAGYANVGKTNLHEFAYGVTSQNLHYGTVPNPAHPGRTSGGSSGGSAAALAAGLADAALGTDTGGSIRIPAACCEIVGFKPTYGLVPADGVFPLAPSFDHVGPMARDVPACVAMMRVLAGVDAAEVDVDDLRVAASWDVECPVSATRVDFPIAEDVSVVFMREVGDVHRELYAENEELYGENIRSKIERCIAVTDAEYEAGLRARADHAARASAAIEGFDLLIVPTLGFPPPPAQVDEVADRAEFVRYTFPFNALGWPALSLPAGGGRSIQVVGRAGDDSLVLGAGLALEAALKT